jgi:hypothetical protein
VQTPPKDSTKELSPGKVGAPASSSSKTVVESVQQRAKPHPKIAASPKPAQGLAGAISTVATSQSVGTAISKPKLAASPKPAKGLAGAISTVATSQGVVSAIGKPNTLPIVTPAQPVSDALLAHGLAGFIVAIAGETSLTAQSTPPQAVHLFCSALVFLLCGVCLTLMLDQRTNFDTPWSGLSGFPTAATTGGLAAAAAFLATFAQRAVFAYARGLGLPAEQKKSVLRLATGWLFNFFLYGAAAAGAYLISHYRLNNEQMTIGFPTRASMALLWNMFATEPLSALLSAAVIHNRNSRRTKQG